MSKRQSEFGRGMKELLICREFTGVRIVCWANKIHKYFKLTLQNNGAHQMPVGLFMPF